MVLTIGVDIGGTKIAAGVVDESGEILRMLRQPSPARDSESVVDTVVNLVDSLKEEHAVEAIGVGAAGFVNTGRDRVIFAPNLAWRDEPLGDRLEEATSLPVVVENDANAAAWGEFRFGAAREFNSAVVITVGTGIGGGIIIDGQLLRGTAGFAGEIGHINMVSDGLPCGCGQQGCWEVYSSGGALLRSAREIARTDRERATLLLDLVSGDPEAITGLMVTQAAQAGCSGAVDAFREIAHWLGQGMADLGAILDPEVFVLAGGVSEAGDVLLEPTKESFEQKLTAVDYREVAPVVLASLGNDAGIIGAADLAMQR